MTRRAPPREDTFVTPSGVDGWVKALPRAKTYFTLDLAAGVPPVVHRFTHDGACPVTIEQGPLRTCADMKWQLFADVRITGEPRARETVVELDAARTATPFDCKHSYSGGRLVEP